MKHMVVPELSRAGRQELTSQDIWRHPSRLEPRGGSWYNRMCDSTRAPLSQEARSDTVGLVAICEHMSFSFLSNP
jgi:hypothetical protein